MTQIETSTNSGIPVRPVYTAADYDPLKLKDKLGEPGRYPFTRGIYPDMYRARPWRTRQYTGFGNAEATNRRFKFLIDQGQTGLSVAFDLPTQLGHDSENKKVEGEIGRVAKMGGAVKAIEKDYVQSRIRESAFQQQMDIESGKKVMVGVNKFAEKEPLRIKIHRIDPVAVKKQIARVKALKRKRDRSRVEMRLDELRRAIDHSENVMPYIIEAVRAKATTGEVSDVFREVYGEFRQRPPTLF